MVPDPAHMEARGSWRNLHIPRNQLRPPGDWPCGQRVNACCQKLKQTKNNNPHDHENHRHPRHHRRKFRRRPRDAGSGLLHTSSNDPGYRYGILGFRPALVPSRPEQKKTGQEQSAAGAAKRNGVDNGLWEMRISFADLRHPRPVVSPNA